MNFQPGVTAIVGPNGCGKSNVSDTIRWVLGAIGQSCAAAKMADVIFNGTDGRKPVGMAEVSLTIGDVIQEQQLRAAGIELSYNEVTLTRRVFRDGGSEYFINRTACRLKDVATFHGTGHGQDELPIMAQANITAILSTKLEDRRTIFEEAAGITKFKSRSAESLRKLEATEQNLFCVQDFDQGN